MSEARPQIKDDKPVSIPRRAKVRVNITYSWIYNSPVGLFKEPVWIFFSVLFVVNKTNEQYLLSVCFVLLPSKSTLLDLPSSQNKAAKPEPQIIKHSAAAWFYTFK